MIKQEIKELIKENLLSYNQMDIEMNPLLRIEESFSFGGVLCDLYRKEKCGQVNWDYDGNSWYLNFWCILGCWGSIPDEVVKWSGMNNKDINNLNELKFEDILKEIG